MKDLVSETDFPREGMGRKLLRSLRRPAVFSVVAALGFSAVTTFNFACYNAVDTLIYDSALYADLAYNFALGRGISFTNIGDCCWEPVTPAVMRSTIVNDPGSSVPNCSRSPVATAILGSFLWLTGLDLVKAVGLMNFVFLWATGFFLCMIMFDLFKNRWACVLVLFIHFMVLNEGYRTTYPSLAVNLFLVASIFFAVRWLRSRRWTTLAACGTALALLFAARYHWVLFVPVVAFLLWMSSGMKIGRFIRTAALPFCIPILLVWGVWTIRNGIVFHDFAFEPRGGLHMYYRFYPDGEGIFFFPDSVTIIHGIETGYGPLPEKVKRNLVWESPCISAKYPNFFSVPKQLRPYMMLAAMKIFVRHPVRYFHSSYLRFMELWTLRVSPAYTPRKTLFIHQPLQDFLKRLLVTKLLLLFAFPLHWYMEIFLLVVVVGLEKWCLRKPFSPYYTLAIAAVLYNIFILVNLSINNGEYTWFNWTATLITVAGAYFYAVRFIAGFLMGNNLVKKALFRPPGP